MGSSLEDIRDFRLRKLKALKESGVDPYPASLSFAVAEIAALHKNFSKLSKSKKNVGIAGRVMASRGHGGSIFLDVFDGSGKFQAFLAEDRVGADSFKLFSDNIDTGDFVALSGKLFNTKRNEPTLEVLKWEILSKSLLPLPEKWHGLTDVEERFRKRYLDILMNSDVKERFLLRSKIVSELRALLDKEGFVEAETPVLQPLYGGALAEPFKTHHRMLDMEMYLRIAPELYLKRLLVAGFSKVYEIGKNFRNEGIDATHNPEFTTVELYSAYIDAEELKKFIIKILGSLIKKVTGDTVFKFEENDIFFKKEVPSVQFWRVIERHALILQPEKLSDEEFLLRASQLGIKVEPGASKAKVADEVFKKVCRPRLIQPTFITEEPVEVSPLAKNKRDDPTLVERFHLIVGGIELMNGFSELNDPEEQKKRMEAQEKFRKAGDKEAEPLDEDFIEALEYGMPPAAGLGLSIDRLTMLLSDTRNIKEVILFPTMKPK
ncbi:lysine--tRNA ligase [Candidatus Giovannonibacteria bacterium]|nr:lysine--tRNA ligase [Candidatus Giovannonibacteria bacterium]